MGSLFEKTPEKLGKFHFEEFEGYAEVTGKGTIAILGTGGELAATGDLYSVVPHLRVIKPSFLTSQCLEGTHFPLFNDVEPAILTVLRKLVKKVA